MILAVKKHPILQLVNDHLIEYPTPSNLSLFWNYGFLAGMCLAIQLITGIALAMHYTPHVDLAFLSVSNFFTAFLHILDNSCSSFLTPASLE